MKNHACSLLAFALLLSPAFGDDGDGNIRSLDAMPQYATALTYPNKSNPHTVGDKVYIRVRMLNYDWD